MCAIVPSMDFVLIVPLTDLSAATVMVPVPDADVVTGGVSCAPVKLIFRSTAKADPVPMMNAAEAISPRMLVRLMKRFIVNSMVCSSNEWIRNCSAPAGQHAIGPHLHHGIRSAYGPGSSRTDITQTSTIQVHGPGGKLPRLPLKGIVPVPAPRRLQQIAPASQPAGPPLTNDVKVLVQQKLRFAHESPTVDREQNPIRRSRCAHAEVCLRVSRALDDDNPADGLAEHPLERQGHRRRQHITAADQ